MVNKMAAIIGHANGNENFQGNEGHNQLSCTGIVLAALRFLP